MTPMVFGQKHEIVWALIGEEMIWKSKIYKVSKDLNLHFNVCVPSICWKADKNFQP